MPIANAGRGALVRKVDYVNSMNKREWLNTIDEGSGENDKHQKRLRTTRKQRRRCSEIDIENSFIRTDQKQGQDEKNTNRKKSGGLSLWEALANHDSSVMASADIQHNHVLNETVQDCCNSDLSLPGEIFLRELISNESNALDKIRYEPLTDPTKLVSCKELDIHINPDKDNKQLNIVDTGIGMTKGDMVNSISTIARSGARAIIEALQSGVDISMIGQFGYIWESSAGRNFTVRHDTTGERLSCGTKITLWLKEDQLEEYLEEREIKDIREREMSDDETESDEAEKKEEDKMNVDEQAEKDDEEKPENYE
ncbi:hypothetical protein GJ496_003711 [Pomphorhynchus laevis]|nr:hypothetical protein GJ496_003711 [Pomphorhynchus laevis]